VARPKKKSEDEALGVRLQWPEVEPTTPIGKANLGPRRSTDAARPRRASPRRKALPPASTSKEASTPTAAVEATSEPANGTAETLERFTERVELLTQAVDGLRARLEAHSEQVAGLATDVSERMQTLQEATDEVARVRAALTDQPKGSLEQQVTELIDEVKATRKSVAVSSGKGRRLDADAVDRIVRSVVERLTETTPPAAKRGQGRRSSAAG
jgi:uncharacterized protein YoxC